MAHRLNLLQDQTTKLLEEEEDGQEGMNGFTTTRRFLSESKNIWFLAAPIIFTSFCQYGLMSITQIFAGHLGTVQLAAVSVENSIIAGLPFGVMFGLSSALETYCGQAFGANQLESMGIYMQKSWVVLTGTALAGVPLFVFAAPVLRLLGQTDSIAREAGKFCVWMIPQQFAYAAMLPSTKFLLAQSKVVPIALIAGVVLSLHAFFTWFFVAKLDWGLVGAALVLDGSWWFTAVAQFLYIVTGACGEAWSGFSWKAFQDLWGFVKVSVASAVMMCLEVWYLMALTLFAGYTGDAEISIDAFSICTNILGWTYVVAIGLNAASSIRVSNELGSGHPRKARFSVVVSGVSALTVGVLFMTVLAVSRNKYACLFSDSKEVGALVEELMPLLGISVVLTNVQYTLCGVAIGAGWQSMVAYMSLGCYFVGGFPMGVLLVYKFNMGIQGLWCGMVVGLGALTCLLLWTVWITNWSKERYEAEERLKRWRS